MQKLIVGIHRFRSEIFGPHRQLFERLARGQTPDALFITCSDSRISPNLLTQTLPGELLILRNAGNLVPPHGIGGGEAATIEFAVLGLGVRDIIICGHSHCGAVSALLNPEQLEAMPALAAWLEHADKTARIVRTNYSRVALDRRLVAAVEENVLVQVEQLQTHPSVAAGLEAGTLAIHAWVYKIETGEVFAYDREAGQFLPLTPEAPVERSPEAAPRLSEAII